MNIGMISKPAHAKSHVQALQKRGHKVITLGGNPSKIQPSLDILVCRPASCSHGGFDTAMAHKRKGGEVIFANGVLEICQAVQGLNPAPLTSAPPKERGVAPLITQLAQLLGVYSSLLHVDEAGPVVQWLANKKGTTDEAMKVWGEARKAYKTNSVRSRLQASGKDSGKEAKKRGWDLHWAHTAPPYGGSRKVALVVADSSVVEETCRRLRVFLTAEEATGHAKAARAAYEAKRKSERGATKAEAAVKVKAAVKAKPKPAPPVVAKTAPVEPPSAVQPGEGGVPRAQAWDAQLKSAIGLLLAEMREVQVTSLTVTTAGAVSFERVVTTTGSMTVDEG